MAGFEYVRATSLAEVSARLAADPDGTRILCGGTDLLVFMFDGKLRPRTLVDPKRIGGLDALQVNGGATIGPCVTMRRLERSPEVRAAFGALSDGAREVGGVAIRNRATLAGNLGTASPAADTPPALLAHAAVLDVQGPHATREVPLSAFYAGPGQHTLAPGELIAAIRLPAVPLASGSAYLKLATRKAMDIAFVGVASWVSLHPDGTVAAARFGLGAVAATPLVVDGSFLAGRALSDEALEAAAEATMAACSPITDKRASAAYRRAMVGELTRRTLRTAEARAEGRR